MLPSCTFWQRCNVNQSTFDLYIDLKVILLKQFEKEICYSVILINCEIHSSHVFNNCSF